MTREIVIGTEITPDDWFVDPVTGWPYRGVIGRREDNRAMAEARFRAAAELEGLRRVMRQYRTSPAWTDPLMREAQHEGVRATQRAIAAIRHIFARPAPRPGRPDLAVGVGADESRDGGARPEALDTRVEPSLGPAAVTPRATVGTFRSP